jgi:BASS family bile acid:Na+ symporter
MLSLFKKYTLPIAMATGILGYKWLGALSPAMPFLIFVMLLLTFTKISLNNLKINLLHFWLLLFEIGFSIVIYCVLSPFNKILAQGAMLCVLCPTATAAAVVTGKLGGSVESVATYTLLANFAVAIVASIFFPLINPVDEISFITLFLRILSRIFPLLIFPFLIAVFIGKFMPKIQNKIHSISGLAFYIWAISLAIVTAITVKEIFTENSGGKIEILLAVFSLILCVLQFFFGKKIGNKYGNKIAGGQSLGQKNTVLAIWLAHSYLEPAAAVGAGTYILWQNIINSWQLYKKQNSKKS